MILRGAASSRAAVSALKRLIEVELPAITESFGAPMRAPMRLPTRAGKSIHPAEFHRTAGEIELMAPERDAVKAQASFERALEIARAQQACSFELRVATSLARLWRDQGRRAEALDLLAPVYGWFTEGFDTPDLKEAKSLLAELASVGHAA